jgi:putative transposase
MARQRGQQVSDTTTETTSTETVTAVPGSSFDEQLAKDLMAGAQEQGVSLVGPGGLLAGLTKTVLGTALEAELTDHLGYEKHDPVGRNGGNSRNGARAKKVVTEVGPVELEVPRDRDGSFDPKIVPNRARRLGGVDEMVILR